MLQKKNLLRTISKPHFAPIDSYFKIQSTSRCKTSKSRKHKFFFSNETKSSQPIAMTSVSLRTTILLFLSAVSAQQTCFTTTPELRDAVDAYLADPSRNSTVAQTYGWPIGSWCVRDIADFSYLFEVKRNPSNINFNEDLTGWVTTCARDMRYMFAGAEKFNGDVSKFQTGRVLNMEGMFEDARAFNGDVSSWDVFNVQDFERMFSGATNFSGDLSEWDMRCAEDISYMFYDAVSFNSDISAWTVTKVKDFRFAFDDAKVFAQNLCPWSDKIRVNLTAADLTAMFTGTACPVNDELGPVVNEDEAGQPLTTLCYDCRDLEG
jgi:surface protein